jgi:hypothetical protein
MLYLISGTSRSGKTIIAQHIFKQTKIPYMSLDWLVMGFTNGIPEYGIHDKLFPDEIAEKFWGFLKAMCENMIWSETDYIIEGEAILPALIRELIDKHPDKIRVCFVGYTDINIEKKILDCHQYRDGKPDWLMNEPDNVIHRHIDNMVTYSRKIERSCINSNIRYFDTSGDFLGAIDEATRYLLDATEY